MAAYSKTFLAFPDGFSQPASTAIHLADSSITSGIPNPLVSYAGLEQSGWYKNLPRVLMSNSATLQVASLIPCLGYEEAYKMPVNASASAHDVSFYAIYGDYSSGGEATRWLVQLLYGTGTMTSSATGLPMTSAAGTAYRTFTGLGTAIPGFNAALDSVIGCTTSAIAGSTTTPQVYSFPHLGGADYLAICASGPSAALSFNCYVRLG